MTKLSETLRERGYVYQHSSETLEEITDGVKRTLYLGVDPTADSMHVGQLQGILVLRRFLEDGHKLVILVGGGTGMIGDPGGKSAERNLQSDEVVDKNTEALRAQFKQLLGDVDFTMVNNAEWLRELNLIDFLRDIGKHFTVNEMIKKDTVRPRLETPDTSISFTEFSYSLLQAYDYLHLHETSDVDLQVGGSDQWGNILPGVDLIRRKKQEQVYALCWPLLINKSTGKKFGKSEGGAVWLDATKTSFFDFYQFWLKSEDTALEEYMLKMTMLSKEEIGNILKVHWENPAVRYGQQRLAFEVTSLVHGIDKAKRAELVSRVLFGKDGTESPVSDADWRLIANDVPNLRVNTGTSLLEALNLSGFTASNREARQFLRDGAVQLNYKTENVDRILDEKDFLNGRAYLQKGKHKIIVLTLSNHVDE